MKRTLEEMTGYRTATREEAEWISKYYSAFFSRRIRMGRRGSTALCVGGLVLLVGSQSTGITGIVLGVLFFLGAFALIKRKNDLTAAIARCAEGRFRVLDGTAETCYTNSEYPGTSNVTFVSLSGQRAGSHFLVRSENVQEGSPLLLVDRGEILAKAAAPIAFTQFMLSDEGIRLV